MGRKRKTGNTKAYLIDRVYERHGALTKQEAADAVDVIFSAVKGCLVDGKAVRIRNFGVFEVVDRAGRSGVNPIDGEPIYIPPHKGLQFRPSRRLKENVVEDEDEG